MIRREAAAGDRLIAVSGLRAGFGRPVVGPLDFTVDRGEVVGLRGPNGAGKTTVIEALIGEAGLFGGTIERPERVAIAYQRQRLPDVSGLPIAGTDIVRVMGVRPDDLPVPVRGRLDIRVDRLSLGQRQLLFVGVALAAPAALVILDEPTNNLDPEAVAEVVAAIKDGPKERGILLVSHDSRFVETVCTHTVEVRP